MRAVPQRGRLRGPAAHACELRTPIRPVACPAVACQPPRHGHPPVHLAGDVCQPAKLCNGEELELPPPRGEPPPALKARGAWRTDLEIEERQRLLHHALQSPLGQFLFLIRILRSSVRSMAPMLEPTEWPHRGGPCW